MDIKELNRIVTLSGAILYTLDVIFSATIYTFLSINVNLPVSNPDLKALLVVIPLISGIFNGIILALLTMGLRYAEYYGLGKSIIAIPIYIAYYIEFNPPIDLASIMFIIIGLNILQIIVLRFYVKIQKELFG